MPPLPVLIADASPRPGRFIVSALFVTQFAGYRDPRP